MARVPKSTNPPSETHADFRELVLDQLASGELDWMIQELDALVDARVASYLSTKNTATTKKNAPTPKVRTTTEKAVAPSRTKIVDDDKESASKIVPEPGKQYLIDQRVKGSGGATIEFVRFRKDDKTKAVVKMVTAVPGAPAGKQVIVPVNMLRPMRRRVAIKKSAAKKTAAKK